MRALSTDAPMSAREKERRETPDRRRGAERRAESVSVPVERRSGHDRRSGLERRLASDRPADQLRAALALLTRVVESGQLGADQMRVVEAAMLRLRFAVEQIEQG